MSAIFKRPAHVDTDSLLGDIVGHWLKHSAGLKTIVFAVNVGHSRVLARPTEQQGLYRQMVGRGLRPAPGKSSMVVLDHSGAIYKHVCVQYPVAWTLEPDKRAANPAHTGLVFGEVATLLLAARDALCGLPIRSPLQLAISGTICSVNRTTIPAKAAKASAS